MKFGQVIEYRKINHYSEIKQKMGHGVYFQTFFCFLEKFCMR